MENFKLTTKKRALNLPIYRLSKPKDRTKSTFIDSNRIDLIPNSNKALVKKK